MGKSTKWSPDVALERLRQVCFGFPAVSEKPSHGAPTFFVRGKTFAVFALDHHGDGRVGAWIKTDHERQRALVAELPARYFVPPYVGVKGWVGVLLDPTVDWDEVTILIEEAWSSVAPRSAMSEPVLPPPPSKPLGATDPAVVEVALARLEAISVALPGTEVEREGRHATFRVKKKPFVYFLDNHHGDGIVGASVRCPVDEAAALVRRHPDAYFIPAYMGPKGWLGLRLDRPRVDWRDVESRVVARHAAAAPAKVAAPRAARVTAGGTPAGRARTPRPRPPR